MKLGGMFVEISVTITNHKIRVKLAFDLGELVRQTDNVCTRFKLLIYRIYAVQTSGE